MRRYLVPIALTAIVGAIIGLMIGLSAQSSIWPRLSLIHIVRSMTVGWMVGLGLSAALACAVGGRVTFSANRDPRLWRRIGRVVLVLVALAQLAGAPCIDGLGRRVLPRRDRDVGGEVYSEGLLHGSAQTALTTDDYRVIYHPSGGEFEVYDRRTDRVEQFDLAHTGEAAEVRERLKLLTDEALRNARATTPSEEGMPQPTELPAETRRRLRTLGYLSD